MGIITNELNSIEVKDVWIKKPRSLNLERELTKKANYGKTVEEVIEMVRQRKQREIVETNKLRDQKAVEIFHYHIDPLQYRHPHKSNEVFKDESIMKFFRTFQGMRKDDKDYTVVGEIIEIFARNGVVPSIANLYTFKGLSKKYEVDNKLRKMKKELSNSSKKPDVVTMKDIINKHRDLTVKEANELIALSEYEARNFEQLSKEDLEKQTREEFKNHCYNRFSDSFCLGTVVAAKYSNSLECVTRELFSLIWKDSVSYVDNIKNLKTVIKAIKRLNK